MLPSPAPTPPTPLPCSAKAGLERKQPTKCHIIVCNNKKWVWNGWGQRQISSLHTRRVHSVQLLIEFDQCCGLINHLVKGSRIKAPPPVPPSRPIGGCSRCWSHPSIDKHTHLPRSLRSSLSTTRRNANRVALFCFCLPTPPPFSPHTHTTKSEIFIPRSR